MPVVYCGLFLGVAIWHFCLQPIDNNSKRARKYHHYSGWLCDPLKLEKGRGSQGLVDVWKRSGRWSWRGGQGLGDENLTKTLQFTPLIFGFISHFSRYQGKAGMSLENHQLRPLTGPLKPCNRHSQNIMQVFTLVVDLRLVPVWDPLTH